MRNRINIAGLYTLAHRGPDGRLRWVRRVPNGVTVEGVNYLQRAFTGGLMVSAWYLGLITDAGYAGLSALDTNASHPTWSEYLGVGAARPLWSPGAVGGGVLASPATAVFGVTVSGTIRGAFLSSRSAVGDVNPAGILYSTGAAEALAVVGGGSVSVSYLVRGTPQS
jgi:hypothetical protein